MHHVVLDHWSRQSSPVHDLDPRAKVIAALIVLAGIATAPRYSLAAYGYLAGALALLLVASRLSPTAVLIRAAAVLPFSAAFAIAGWAAGDPARGWCILGKAYLSAWCVLLLTGTTPLPGLLRALEWLRVPALLITVAQFLYRYLFVLSEQAQHMRVAAKCRLANTAQRSARFRAAAGALGVLFARSYDRAEMIHRAMLARGYQGRLPSARKPGSLSWRDVLYVAASLLVALLPHFSVWRAA